MGKLNLFEHHVRYPLSKLGLTSSFWGVNIDTLIYTWIAIIIIFLLIFLGRVGLSRPGGMLEYVYDSFIRTLKNMMSQTLGFFNYKYFAFIGSLFIYILICNLVAVLPFVEEPTKDLNTTFALAVLSFLYVQKEGIRVHGLWGYIKELSKPIFLFFPLEVMSKVATVISLSFRLFGNIFGGAVITSMWQNAIAGSFLAQTAGLLFGINFVILIFFGIFESFIQAFVFSILSLTYLSMSITEEAHE